MTRSPPATLMPILEGPPHDLGRLIEVLNRHGVEYLRVSGTAGELLVGDPCW